jgi:hypothetical protein
VIVLNSHCFHRLDLISPLRGIGDIASLPMKVLTIAVIVAGLALSAAWAALLGFELFRLIEPVCTHYEGRQSAAKLLTRDVKIGAFVTGIT